MTSNKPFTAEQLDRIETASKFLAQSPEEHEVMLRLIAQAREEIRLREMLSGATFDITTPLDDIAPSGDPAARAKRELGEWLAAEEGRSWGREYAEHQVRVVLTEFGRHVATGAWCNSNHEAITAALRAAKESER